MTQAEKQPQQTTSKKVKYVGTQDYINAITGEIETMQVTSYEDRDFNFAKVWMKNFLATLDIVGNRQTKFCFWLIDHVNKENQLIGTYRSLAADSGVSLGTVKVTMKALLEANFLRKKQNGVYIINPDIVFKGSRNARMNALTEFTSTDRREPTDEEKLQNLIKSIGQLQRQAATLQAKIQKEKTLNIVDLGDGDEKDELQEQERTASN